MTNKIKLSAITLALTAVLSACGSNTTQQVSIESPNKNIKVDVSLNKQGEVEYSIYNQGQLVLEPSKLGVMLEGYTFDKTLTVADKSKATIYQDNYSLLSAKKHNIEYTATSQSLTLNNAQGQQLQITFNVSNDGVAFKYSIEGEAEQAYQFVDELTEFDLKADASAFIQPIAVAQTGWSNTNPSYEEHYLIDVPVDTKSPTGAGWVFPALYKTDNTWLAISETGIDRHHHASRLAPESPEGVYTIDQPMAAEVFTNKKLLANGTFPYQSPWRIISLGDLATVAESTLGTDLAKANQLENIDFVKPGVSSWSWGLLKDDYTIYPVQKEFIDHAANMNWQYTLVDADWDRKIGFEKLQQLADYAKSKNVGLFVWYNSSGEWNETPYTPRHKLLDKDQRLAEFSKLKKMGIAGLKIDFFAGDGQSMIDYYIDILEDAADFELMINFHGATLPRGLNRTYPNLMTVEAVHGLEMVTFFQNSADKAASHSTVLPFTRNLYDPMDYTPTTFNELTGEIKRKTTNALELAQAVLFVSGVQHIVETPDGMPSAPYYAIDLLKQLPASWDDSKYIAGTPGKLAVFARKKGNLWYIAGINGETTAKDLELDLSFLGSNTGRIIQSGEGYGNMIMHDMQIDGKTKVSLQGNDGFVMVVAEGQQAQTFKQK